jgi:hypothetical protein
LRDVKRNSELLYEEARGGLRKKREQTDQATSVFSDGSEQRDLTFIVNTAEYGSSREIRLPAKK